MVALASVMDNREEVNLVKRIVFEIDSTGVDEIVLMPDYCQLGAGAVSGLGRRSVGARMSILDTPVTGTHED